MTEPNDYVGDRFISYSESRTPGRTIKVLAQEVRDDRSIRLRVENTAHPTLPSAVGRKTWIAERTLHNQFRKISRD